MRKILNLQFIRFLAVGVLNTAFSYGLYAGMIWLGLPYVAANFLATALGILFSFRTQGQLVFGNRDPRLIVRFSIGWLLIWIFNILLIGLLIRHGLDAYWAGGIALIPTTLASYVVQKLFVFRSPPTGTGGATESAR